MRTLIVGGTGLISSAITEMLIKRGDDVVLYNRGASDNNFGDGVQVVRGDRRNFARFESDVRQLGHFDCVMDMVCFTPEEAKSTVRACLGVTEQIIFCSTVDVYTKAAEYYPIDEKHERNPSKLFSYAWNKKICEDIFWEASGTDSFSVTIIRPAQTYGGPIHAFRNGTYILDRLRKHKPIIVHGDGSSLWTACHKQDVARAFVKAIGNPLTYNKQYHVTGEEWMTWNDYWRKVAEILGVEEPDIVHIPTDVLHSVLPNRSEWCALNFQFNNIFDNSAAKRDLDFQYTINWETGMKSYIEDVIKRNVIENCDDYPFYDQLIYSWTRAVHNMTNELKGWDTLAQDHL